MLPTVFQKAELRDANDNIIQQGAYGKGSALSNATNTGWIDYVMNNLEFLYDLAKDEIVPVDTLPASGDMNKTYLLTTTGVCYRWDGTEWVEISSSEAVGRAEAAADLAEEWAEDAEDTAEDIADHLAQIDQNTGGVSANSKRITNIEKLLQGNLYDYDTDDDTAYTKTVPAGAMPYASLEQIGGKTLVWNQLVDSGTTEVSTISGHQYYTLIDGTASIVTSDGTAITIVDDTADMVVDLTLCFGAGSEPSTTADFTAIFGATHYPYNAGTLLSAGVTSIFSEGQNLVNPANFTTNGVSYSDGVITVDTDTRNYRDLYTGTSYTNTAVPVADIPKLPYLTPGTYTFAMDSFTGGNFRLSIYTVAENGSVTQVIGNLGVSDTTLTFDKPTRITMRSRYSSTITNLRITKTASTVPYRPYFSETYPIPAEIRALTGYGWSAGSVYNYIDFERKVFVQNVGKVILDGTQTSVSTNFTSPQCRVCYSVPNVKLIDSLTDPDDSIVSDYLANGTLAQSQSGVPCLYRRPNGSSQIWVSLGSIGTSAGVDDITKTNNYLSSNPLTVYYALETPTETDISQYLTDDNLLEVESGGTLTFPNSNGSDYLIPVPSEETYMIDLQSALGE